MADAFRKAIHLGAHRLRSLTGLSQTYRCGDTVVSLPAEHLLPAYQRIHPLYDRFLPLLVTHLEPGSWVIDVGANVGDTLAAMIAANAALKFVCVEADEAIFRFLDRNVAKIVRVHPDATVRAVQAFVGQGVNGVDLAGSGGTRHAVEGGGSLRSQPLAEILLQNGVTNPRLVKSDVDGFDFDVIDSAMPILDADQTLVYFECQFDNARQKAGYEATLERLGERGFNRWTLFDNVGSKVLSTDRTADVFQLLDYVWKQNAGPGMRTIHYFDILASGQRDSELVDNVLRAYGEIAAQ
jgi:FkbM family methyltransferase